MTVHPRACGEHRGTTGKTTWIAGSSPRLRGTRARDPALRRRKRFIPAPAGNTPGPGMSHRRWSVHPRACGEHVSVDGSSVFSCGSSPRLRGTRQGREAGGHRGRFIPAPAGNTRVMPSRAILSAVHPRACGEHGGPEGAYKHHAGSSPRLRGTHVHGAGRVGWARFIPAPAGNTLASKWLIAQRNHDVKEPYRRCGFVLGRPMPSSRRRASSRREGRRPPV